MTCDERYDSLLQYALGTLGGPELEEVRAHLKGGCPVCAGRLAESHAVLGMLPLALPPVTLPLAARRRLLDRIGTLSDNPSVERAPAPLKRSSVSRPRVLWWGPALLGAAMAASVTVLIYSNILSTQRLAMQATQDRLVAAQHELDRISATSTDAGDLLHLVQSPSVRVVTLKPQPMQNKGFARLILDSDNRVLRVYASNLKPLSAGKGYELWLFNGSAHPIPAGAFQVNAEGDGSMECKLSGNPGQVIQVAITDEPYNGGKGLTQPSGIIQFKQEIQ